MRALKLIIVDDEPLARLRLRGLVADCSAPAAEIVAEAGSASEALHAMALHRADGLLLDIHMPGSDGLQLAARLRTQRDAPAVIFVTAHAEHALEAFDIEAVDYLTKPVRQARLQQALQRLAQRVQLPPVAAPAETATERPVLVVSDRGRVLRVPVDDIVYVKAEMKYVTLRTRTHSYVLDDALADLEQRLGDAVIRIHRNAVVATAAVRALERRPATAGDDAGTDGGEGWAVQVAPVDEWLSVSRRQLPSVRKVLEGGA